MKSEIKREKERGVVIMLNVHNNFSMNNEYEFFQ
jgi:hypothetical protein